MRIMSIESSSRVYHRPECRYAGKIDKRNRIKMRWEDAEWKGYRPCKCCDGIDFLYKMEKEKIERYAEQFNINVDFKDRKIYVRTDVGCWKIIYKIRDQIFILLHRNYVNGRIELEDAEKAPFHRQGDIPESGSIMKYLKYIKAHDEFKYNAPNDYRTLPQNTARQKLYYNTAKKRAEKSSAKRLDMLFCLIEKQEGINPLSCC
ncbi:MAG: hypothetical protein NC433_16395 [Clostridiales bacterium]|nr:hypothetical protein [Clostridiales bacterium]